MVFEHESYRTYLKDVLSEVTARNPSYSLRALAQRTGLSASFLSEVLRGLKNLSAEAGLRVAKRLGLPADEAEYFCLLIQLESSKDPEYRAAVLEKLRQLRPNGKARSLDVDSFKVISDWYHFVILEMTHLSEDLSPKAIARELEITELEAEAALARLLRLELLERTATGSFRKTSGRNLVAPGGSHRAINSFYRQIIDRLLGLLDSQDYPERISAADIVPIASSRMEEVKRAIERCSDEICAISEECPEKDAVYAVSLHAFKLVEDSTLQRKKKERTGK